MPGKDIPEILIDDNPAVTADVDAAVAANGALRIYGYSCRESAGSAAAATFRIIHGATGASGAVIETVELSANESRGELWEKGIPCPNGISIDHIAGTVDVHIRYAYVS